MPPSRSRTDRKHSTAPPEMTDFGQHLILTFGLTLQFEGVTMKQGCFSTAGLLTVSRTIIVGTACQVNDVMLVNLKGHVEYNSLHAVFHHPSRI